MWVKFNRSHDWVVPGHRGQSIDYRQGCSYSVKRAWGEAMIRLGVCEPGVSPRGASVDPADEPDEAALQAFVATAGAETWHDQSGAGADPAPDSPAAEPVEGSPAVVAEEPGA